MRLFIGVPVPRALKAGLLGLMNQDERSIFWTAPDNLHLTLKFIGEFNRDRLRALEDTLIETSVRPFQLEIKGVGAFRARRTHDPLVIYAAFKDPPAEVFELQRDLDYRLKKLGLRPEARAFVPHITLGRCKAASKAFVKTWEATHQSFDGGSIQVDFFRLYESSPSLKGHLYHPLITFSLHAMA